MLDIKIKRASLEAYLREQIIGPGAGRNRVVRTNKDTDLSFLNQNYSGNSEEALTVVPGVYYSSGILFPNKGKRKKEDRNTDEILKETDVNTVDETFVNADEETDENNNLEERKFSEVDSGIQMDQKFPKAMGLTFCMKADNLKKEGFEIVLSGRHYQRVLDDDVKNFGVRIELLKEDFIEILTTIVGDCGNLGTYFKIEEKGIFSFVKRPLNNSAERCSLVKK